MLQNQEISSNGKFFEIFYVFSVITIFRLQVLNVSDESFPINFILAKGGYIMNNPGT